MRQIRVNEMGAMPDPQKPQGVAAEQQPKKVEIQMTQPEQTAPDKDLSATEVLGFERSGYKPITDKDFEEFPDVLLKSSQEQPGIKPKEGIEQPKAKKRNLRKLLEQMPEEKRNTILSKMARLAPTAHSILGVEPAEKLSATSAASSAAAGPGQIIMGSGLRNVGVGFEAALRNLFPILNTSAEAVKDARKPDAEAQPKSEAETPKED